jgi:hypothetical protein
VPQREPTRLSSQEIARRVLERGSLPQPHDDDFQQWTAVAADIDDAAGIGAVAAVRRSGRQAWYAAIEICRRGPDGRWHPDQGNGDQWSQDPRRRPPGSGFVSGTSTYGCQVQGVWIVTFAGILGEDVTALRLVEPTAREVAINPVNGAYVVAAARRAETCRRRST